MQEKILLAIVLPLVNAGEYFVGIVYPLLNAGKYFIGYCPAIYECWGIWLLSGNK